METNQVIETGADIVIPYADDVRDDLLKFKDYRGFIAKASEATGLSWDTVKRHAINGRGESKLVSELTKFVIEFRAKYTIPTHQPNTAA